MTRKPNYVQCTMRRSVPGGDVSTVAYIPEPYARLGRVLKLKHGRQPWVDGWVVEQVSTRVVPGAEVRDCRQAIRHHRKATGDSLPRLS